MGKKFKGFKKTMSIILVLVMLMSTLTFAFAENSLQKTKFAKGTENLINDTTTWLLVIVPLAAILGIIYCVIKKIGADDEMAYKTWDKKIKIILGSAILGETASAMIKVILAYYQ